MSEPENTAGARDDELTPEQLELARNLSPDLARSLVSLKHSIDKRGGEALHIAEIVQLPLWPEPARAMPNPACFQFIGCGVAGTAFCQKDWYDRRAPAAVILFCPAPIPSP